MCKAQFVSQHEGKAMFDLRAGAEEVDDAILVARVVDGNRAAFEALYRRHQLSLFRTALAMTRDQGAAEEILQEAFLRAFRHMGRVQLPEGGSLRPWLHRIVINLVYDWSARRRAHVTESLEHVFDRLATASSLSPERQVERHELAQVVDEAIDKLPFKQRVVIILFYVHDMDLCEIAETLDVPPGTVKSRLFYARERLREQLLADRRLPLELELPYASPAV
jgi:RNA polymerase sigma-70 factor (ECF subfamily)